MNRIANAALDKLISRIVAVVRSNGIYPEQVTVGGVKERAKDQVVRNLTQRHDRILRRWPHAYGTSP
jgi:hypothetical protein